ncbi:MAG: hypothetical protein GXY63_02625 [Spirochaetales bacterium]|nr:hypothetical protein [Spirochaetales bacterium]
MGLELLLPVVFFLITLIIIYLLRVEDRRDRRLDLIKKRMSDFSAEVERVIQNFRDTAQITEERITKRVESSKALTARLDEQLADLQNRSDDLLKLQEVLNTYRDSISRLGATTATVESRIGQVRREVERLEAVNTKIKEFDNRLEERTSLFERLMEEEDDRWEDFSKKLEQRYAQYQKENEVLMTQHEAYIEIGKANFSELEQRFEEQTAEHSKSIDAVKGQFNLLLEQSRETFDSLYTQTDEACQDRLHTFSGECDTELQTMVQTASDRIDEAFQTMVRVIISFIQELEDRASQSEELNEVLVRQQKANLAEYSEEIQLLQELSTQSESAVRRDELRRRELLEVRTHLREETVALRSELDQMIREKQTLLNANAQAKQEQEHLQSALGHLSLTLIERQDELIRSNEGEPFTDDEDAPIADDDQSAEQEDIVDEEPVPNEGDEELMQDDAADLGDDFEDEADIEEEDIADVAEPTESDEELFEDDAPDADDDFEDDAIIEEDDADEEPASNERDEELLDDDAADADDDFEDDLIAEEDDADDGHMTGQEESSVIEALEALSEETGSRQEDVEAAVLDEVHEAEAPRPSEATAQEERAWVEYIPEGEEEEISLDDDDDLNP